MTTRWIEDGERLGLMRPYAQALWDGRDTAIAIPGQVSFGSCRYLPVKPMSDDDEFASAISLLVDGDRRMEMPWRRDHMVVAHQAVVAWKILADLTGTTPVLPARIEMRSSPRSEAARPSIRASIATALGTRWRPSRFAPRTVSSEEPTDVVRYELARLLEGIVREEGATRTRGMVDMPLRRGLTMDTREMVVRSAQYGDVDVHLFWRRAIAETIRKNESADPGHVQGAAGRDQGHWGAEEI